MDIKTLVKKSFNRDLSDPSALGDYFEGGMKIAGYYEKQDLPTIRK